MGDCQFAHGRKELRKYSLRVYSNDSWVEQRQQCTTRFLFRGHFTIVLLTGMTALTEDEDISEAIMLKPLPFVVRRASQSANTHPTTPPSPCPQLPYTCRASSCVLGGSDDPIVWMEMPLQIGDRPVRITGDEHDHVFGLVRESFSQGIDSIRNGFQCLVIDHGHTLTVIRQQPSCPNVNADGEDALMDDAVYLSNGVSHLLVGSEKGSENHASILLPCLVGSHDSALDEEFAIVLVVDVMGGHSSISHDRILVEAVFDVDSVVDNGEAGTSVVTESHGSSS